MIDRPKYLEYRHRRDQMTMFKVQREVTITVEKPAPKWMRLVGKKTQGKSDSYEEEWILELRVSDVRPDYSGLVKTQVRTATRTIKGEPAGYEDMNDPTTEFLNETVDRFGGLREVQGTLPTPHLLLFPEEPQKTGGQWERSRQEMLPVSGPDGQIKGFELMTVTYQGTVDGYGDDGTEYADISITGLAGKGREGDPVWQEYAVTGNIRFAIREGHIISGHVLRQMKTHLEMFSITTRVSEEMEHASQETERSVGGMRL